MIVQLKRMSLKPLGPSFAKIILSFILHCVSLISLKWVAQSLVLIYAFCLLHRVYIMMVDGTSSFDFSKIPLFIIERA